MSTIYQDKNILAINKPAGLVVHPDSKHKSGTLIQKILKDYPGAELAHRLDKDTSGVLLIAKNEKSYEFLKEQFKNRKVKKIYIALVKGEITLRQSSGQEKKTGIIDTPIQRYTKSRDAITEYKIIKKLRNYTLLEVYPKTGRTHQIRIHLKSIGYPIVCEKFYTKKPECPFGLTRHFLHAQSIELSLSDGSRTKIEADLPQDLQKVLTMLENKT